MAATIARMCEYVCADYPTYLIQEDARQALSIDPSNPLGCVHHFVRSRLEFCRDEKVARPFHWLLKKPAASPDDPKPGEDFIVEMLKRPVDVSFEFLKTGERVQGDCDDHAQYCAALLKALGIECCFATVAANADEPNVFSHVYVVAYWNGQKIPIDASHGPYAGWQTNRIYRYQEWPITDRAVWAGLGIALALAGVFAWKHRAELKEWFT